MDFRYSNINTTTSQQQNPFKVLQFPCNKEWIRLDLGACNYLLLLDYPTDIKVYISLNSNDDNKIELDVRNTGFKISDIFTEQGTQGIIQNVHLWTKGITSMVDSEGNPASVRIVTSGITQIEMLYNASISALNQIGQIGRLGLVEAINQLKEVLQVQNVQNVQKIEKIDNVYTAFPNYASVSISGQAGIKGTPSELTRTVYPIILPPVTNAQGIPTTNLGTLYDVTDEHHLINISKAQAIEIKNLGKFVQTHIHEWAEGTGSGELAAMVLIVMPNCLKYAKNGLSAYATTIVGGSWQYRGTSRGFVISGHNEGAMEHKDFNAQWRPQDIVDMEAVEADTEIAQEDIIISLTVCNATTLNMATFRCVSWIENEPQIQFKGAF